MFKHTLTTTAAFASAITLIGCSDSGAGSASSPETSAQKPAQVETPVAASADDFTDDQIESFTNAMEERLTEVADRVESIKEDAADLTGDAKAEFNEAIAALDEQRQALASRLDELQDSGTDAWTEMKIGLERSWNELSDAVDEAADKFGKA